MLKKEDVFEAITRARANAPARKFTQSVDCSVNFTGIDFSKQQNRVDVEVSLPHGSGGGGGKAIVFVKDKNFASALKGKADRIVTVDEIPSIKKKELDELLGSYSVFLAEGPAMLVVGKYLGQQLAPRGRMPKPVEPTIESFERAISRFGSAIKLSNKKGKNMPVVHVKIGNEKSSDSDLAENINAIYDALVAKLPNKQHSIKSVIVKLTMGAPAKIGDKNAAQSAAVSAKKVAVPTAAKGVAGSAKPVKKIFKGESA